MTDNSQILAFMPAKFREQYLASIAKADHRAYEQEKTLAVKWTNSFKWAKQVCVDGPSFCAEMQPWLDAWGVPPTGEPHVNRLEPGRGECVDHGAWRLRVRTLPAGVWLAIAKGHQRGRVSFTTDVPILALHLREAWGQKRFEGDPYMSLTPNEVITLRPGSRFAHGHAVVAGLGLGWLLLQVMCKRTVARITLIERDKSLCNWVLPRLKKLPGYDGSKLEVQIGDARHLAPLTACDVVLVDIAKGYGGNTFEPCPLAKRVWVWGAC